MMRNDDNSPNGKLLFAAQKNNPEGIQEALSLGADVDYVDPMFSWTSLQLASLDGKAAAVQVPKSPGAHPVTFLIPTWYPAVVATAGITEGWRRNRHPERHG